MRAPALPILCAWVKAAWNEIDKEMVIKAFKKCGISNAMDGTEDEILYEDAGDNDELDRELEDDQYDDCLDEEEFLTLFPDTASSESDCEGF